MLQRLLIITLTLCSLTASAQWQQTGSKVRYVNGLGIPTKDTAAGVAADSSQILIRPADSSLYIKYKRTWVKVGAGGGGTIGGSGTTNRVPKFTASTTLGNSSIVDSASAVAMTISPLGRIGIGTTSPGGVLDVKQSEINITSYTYGLDFKTTGAGGFSRSNRFYNTNFLSSTAFFGVVGDASTGVTRSYWVIGNPATDSTGYTNTNGVHLLSSGNVGIGYTAPATKLSVNGTALINTNTDNGVDKLQVSGSMSVSTLATAQNLSVTNNATISNKLAIRTTTQTANLTVLGGYSIGGSIPTDWNFMSAGRAGVVSGNKGFYFDIIGSSYAEFSTFDWGTSQPYNMVFQGNGGRILAGTTSDNTVDRLQVNGSISGIGMKQAYVTKTGAYTATNDDYVIDCTSGTFTVTLPASSGRTGRILIIKNSGAGTITVDGNASETIDGATTYSLSVQYATVQIMSDGTNWKIIAKF
jgi:hypothetical protein